MAGLTIVTGAQSGTHFELASRPLSVGRDPSRDIQIVDPKVSRKHAMIRHDNGRYLIAATKALNGITINGAAADGEATLMEGDEIQLGDTLLRFGSPNSPDATNAVHHRKNADRAVRENNTLM
ncbi:MAG: FHA domain-containing protein [Planctomycetota bacterium]|nr:MAG: FHA domain-containing protein [Planctomycetota bacterium]